MASRRAYRPDRHVYRDLRRAPLRRRSTLFWVEVALAIAILTVGFFLIRWLVV